MPFESRDDIKIENGAIVVQNSILEGDITIGKGTIVNPNVRIIAKAGPILIGNNCVIDENVEILNESSAHSDMESGNVMVVGDNNHFRTGCKIRCVGIGNENIIGVLAVLEKGSFLPSRCYIGPKCVIRRSASVSEGTYVESAGESLVNYERNLNEPLLIEIQQTWDIQSKLIPQYNKIVKANI